MDIWLDEFLDKSLNKAENQSAPKSEVGKFDPKSRTLFPRKPISPGPELNIIDKLPLKTISRTKI